MKRIRLLVADDHQLIRSGLKLLLEKEESIELVGEAENGNEAVALASEVKPDIVLLDIEMPECNGLEAAGKILAQAPGTGIIILSMHSYENYLMKSIELGCMGYLLKKSDTREVLQAIKKVADGENYYGSGIAQSFLMASARRKTHKTEPTQQKLSKRELEVLTLIAEGHSSKEIADKLFISVRTVDTHRSNILHKLKMNNSAQLVRYAIINKLVELPD